MYFDYDAKVSINTIQKEMDSVAIRRGDYHKRLSPIEFKNKIFDTREEAEEYVEKYFNNHNYEQIAVRYKDIRNFKPSKKLINLWAKRDEMEKKYLSSSRSFYFSNHKSSTVTCKKCGSRITLSYLRGNICPVCRADLRPETVIDKENSYKQKWNDYNNEAEKLRREEYKKQINKATEKWLVKIEFHT